jgi:hypothetical protein
MSRRELQLAVTGLLCLVFLVTLGLIGGLKNAAEAGGWPRGGLAGTPGGAAGIASTGAAGTGTTTFDRTIVGIDGTASNSTICFGDTNTCIYRGGLSAEDLSFVMGGGTAWSFRTDQIDPNGNNTKDLGNSLRNFRTAYIATSISAASTDSTGTPGAATINQMCGKSAIANGASAVTITNSTVAATTNVFVQPTETDATCNNNTGASNWIAVAGSGSFVVTAPANCTAATNFDWCVIQ